MAQARTTPYNARPMAKQKKHPQGTIALNKKALHDYFIEHKFEAGLVLSGWEVKSLRAGKAQLVDSYVLLKDDEAWLMGCHITPLKTASTHVIADPTRTRKLLLNKRELEKLFGSVQQRATPPWRCRFTGSSIWSNAKLPWPRARRTSTSATPRKSVTPTVRFNVRCAARARTTKSGDRLQAKLA